jgi:hypothetical protein
MYDEVTDVPSNQALHEYVIAKAPLFPDEGLGREFVHSLLHHSQEGLLLFIFPLP